MSQNSMMKILRLPKVQLTLILFTLILATLFKNPVVLTVRLFFLTLFFTVSCDLLFIIFKKIKVFFPYSAIVTGLILILTINPATPWYGILIISALAMASKNFIRFKNKHIFNPAAFGLVVGSVLFKNNVSWWGVSVPSLLFFVLMFFAFLISGLRMRRLWSILSFLLTYAVVYSFVNLRVLNIFTAIFDPTVIFFAVVMLPEPMTTPALLKKQILFGVSMACFILLLPLVPAFQHIISLNIWPDGLLPYLLLGNLVFFR